MNKLLIEIRQLVCDGLGEYMQNTASKKVENN